MILKEKVTPGGHDQFWIILDTADQEGKGIRVLLSLLAKVKCSV